MDHQSQVLGLFSTPKYLSDPATRTRPHGTKCPLAPATGSGRRGGWSRWSEHPGRITLVPCHGNTQEHFLVIPESDGHMAVPLTLFSPFFILVTCATAALHCWARGWVALPPAATSRRALAGRTRLALHWVLLPIPHSFPVFIATAKRD